MIIGWNPIESLDFPHALGRFAEPGAAAPVIEPEKWRGLMFKGGLLWLIGIPIPIILLLWLFGFLG